MPSQLTRKVMPYTAFAAQWTFGNDFLEANEVGIEGDTGKMKQGPGRWNDLEYMNAGRSDIAYFVVDDEAARLALEPEPGDECEQLDEGVVYKYLANVPESGSGSGSEEGSGSGSEEGDNPGWVVLWPQT